MSTTATDSLSAEDIPFTVPVTDAKPEGNLPQARQDAAPGGPEQEYPSGPKFWLMGFALCLGGFLVSLVSHPPPLTHYLFLEHEAYSLFFSSFKGQYSRGHCRSCHLG
jgi:hypothetical protein